MSVAMATSPGQVGRPNEDFIGAVPDAVVLLDGAGIPGTEDICRHGVAWYAQTLVATLLARLRTQDCQVLSECSLTPSSRWLRCTVIPATSRTRAVRRQPSRRSSSRMTVSTT